MTIGTRFRKGARRVLPGAAAVAMLLLAANCESSLLERRDRALSRVAQYDTDIEQTQSEIAMLADHRTREPGDRSKIDARIDTCERHLAELGSAKLEASMDADKFDRENRRRSRIIAADEAAREHARATADVARVASAPPVSIPMPTPGGGGGGCLHGR
jgi:septal ring factor EnvC (AmiA/AmiB activator)